MIKCFENIGFKVGDKAEEDKVTEVKEEGLDLNTELIEIVNKLVGVLRNSDGTIKGISINVNVDSNYEVNIKY